MSMQAAFEKVVSRLELEAANVGFRGGDLQTRFFAGAVLLALVVMVFPPTDVSPAAMRIATLAAAMFGTVFLMTGLVFAQRTHYAGIVLTAVPLMIKWLAQGQLSWVAVILGALTIGGISINVATRRCGVNRALRISSV